MTASEMLISDLSSDVCSSVLRLARAQRIDALVDDLARGIHRIRYRLRLPRARRSHHDARRVDDIDVPVALSGQPGALRLAEQPLARGVELRLVADEEAD